MELVTGATGYIGGRLIERLLAEGRPVRALARDPSRLEPRAGVEVAAGRPAQRARGSREALDGLRDRLLPRALDGGRESGSGDFADRDRRAAENFADAAARTRASSASSTSAASRRPTARPLAHIASRLEVEQILLDAAPAATALRASIVIGARLVLVPPARAAGRAAARAAVARLAREPDPADRRARRDRVPRAHAAVPTAAGRSLDIAGPDVLSYGAMIERIADSMGVGRLPLGPRR